MALMRIFSSGYTVEDKKLVFSLYGKTEMGVTRLRVLDTVPYFQVANTRRRPDFDSRVAGLLGTDGVVRQVPIVIEHTRVMYDAYRIEMEYPFQVPRARSKFEKFGSIFSSDITFDMRMQYDNDWGCTVSIPDEMAMGVHIATLAQIRKTSRVFDPKWAVLSFDIENSMRGNKRIFCICVAVRFPNGLLKIRRFSDESELDILRNFCGFIRMIDPDVITGYNIYNYDIKVLHQRSEANKFSFNWGRDGKDMGTPRKSEGSRVFEWDCRGRLILDAQIEMRMAFHPKRETLRYVSHKYLDMEKGDIDPGNIDEEWANNRDRVLEYCDQDARLALLLLEKSGKLTPKMTSMTIAAKLPLDRVINTAPSHVVDSLLIRAADARSIGVPANRRTEDGKREKIKGGYVHRSTPGLFKGFVMVFDFKGMYPSIMIENNICFTTISDQGTIVAPLVGHRFLSRDVRRGLIGEIQEYLGETRAQYKKLAKIEKDPDRAKYFDSIQGAVKIIMNAFYGLFTSEFYRFTDRRIGESITAFARDDVKFIIDTLEAEGLQILYGDTDSCFVASPHSTLDETVKFGTTTAERFSAGGKILEMEKILSPFFMNSRKKRYVGNQVWPAKLDEYVVRGFETRRGDSFDFLTDVMDQMFEILMQNREDELIPLARESIITINQGLLDTPSLVKSKSVQEESTYKNPETQIQVRVARMLRARGFDIPPGQKVSWIVTDGDATPQGIEPYVDTDTTSPRPDLKYYSAAFVAAAARITEVFGYDEESLRTGRKQWKIEEWCP